MLTSCLLLRSDGLQALALKLRAEGKNYKPNKKPKRPASGADTDTQQTQIQKKSRNGSAKHQAPQQQPQQPWQEEGETGSRPDEEVQVCSLAPRAGMLPALAICSGTLHCSAMQH